MAEKHAAKKSGRLHPGKPPKRERFDKKKVFPKQKRRGEVVDEEINSLKEKYETTDRNQLNSFRDFPFCHKTQRGLQNAEYTKPTDIQREAILLALRGHDILGAAKTGSGKTLAFLIPILECLYRLKWSQDDGLGVLVITPTRELAYQIYEVLRKIGKFHDFSAGLVIGGKHLKAEAARIQRTNIVICTPGRLQQHLDETPYFSADSLQMLVLDEADRILDLGFQQCMNAIIENLPVERQTLLFSATQTKSVKDLARLSLKEPMYVSVHEMAKHSTPPQLRQSYIVCEQHEKLDLLWSFVKNHLKAKTMVFLTSCKEVRFVFEAFRRMRPGVTVLSLHGAMHQLKRVEVYNSFCRKRHAVLFATDIAARGLDFPAVNWVVQLDCPEDSNTYIHRAGRTARYEKDGEALLVLLPSEEESMLKQLEEKKIPINKIKVNVKKMSSIKSRLESFCAAEVQLKEFAQRCFVSYMKAIYLMKNKDVFDVTKIDTDAYAGSLGLAIPPRVRFIQRKMQKFSNKEALTSDLDNVFKNPGGTLSGQKTANEQVSEEESESDDEEETNLQNIKNSGDKIRFDVGDDEIDDILTMKKKNAVKVFESEDEQDEEGEEKEEEENLLEQMESNKQKKKAVLTKAKLAKKLQRKNIKVNTKMTFDDEGEEEINRMHTTQAEIAERTEPQEEEEEDEEEGGLDLEEAKRRMEEEDKIDKEIYRERIKRRHREKRLKEKEERRKESGKVKEAEEEMEDIDLNFLPDPDKIKGRDDDDHDDDDDDDDEDDDSPPAKRLRSEDSEEEESGGEEEEDESNEEEGGSEEEGEEEGGADMEEGPKSLEDDEALALRLLG